MKSKLYIINMLKVLIFTFLIISTFIITIGYAQSLSHLQNPESIKELLLHSDQARGQGNGLIWDVLIKDYDGAKRTLTVKSKGDKGLATFLAPPKVKGQVLLKRGYNMWFIKPGVSKPISISPRLRLLGGLANADIASTNYAEDYEGKIIDIDSVEGENCYVLDLRGRTKKVTYDQIKYWISSKRRLGLKAEFFSVSGKHMKTAYFKYENKVDIKSGLMPFISEMKVVDVQKKDAVTVMQYSNIHVVKLDASEFSFEQLQ
jgi:outer membrane lipoprotein-sorting protein